MDVYDFMIQGETKTYYPEQYTATTYKAGKMLLIIIFFLIL